MYPKHANEQLLALPELLQRADEAIKYAQDTIDQYHSVLRALDLGRAVAPTLLSREPEPLFFRRREL